MPKKSDVYGVHFTRLTNDNGEDIKKAKCMDCTEDNVLDTEHGTTNLWRHLVEHFTHPEKDDQGRNKCGICQSTLVGSPRQRGKHVLACIKQQGAAAVEALRPPLAQTRDPPGAGSSSMDFEPADSIGVQPLPSAPSSPGGSSSKGEEPDMEEAKHHLAKMITLRGCDPSIINDDCFKSFVESLNPKFKLPSFKDIAEVCHKIVWEQRRDLLNLSYDSRSGRTSLAVGKATIIESEVIYVACHFIDYGWNLHKVIRDGAINPIYVVTRLNIELEMMSSAEEHCDENDATLFMVAWGLTDDRSKLEDFLGGQDLPTPDFLGGALCTTFMDYILHSIAQRLYLNIDEEFRRVIPRPVLFSNQKEERKALSRAGLDLWAYKEAWYSCYCFLSIRRSLGFSELLYKIFDEIYHAIRKISASSSPTANLCLVELFNVRRVLQSEIALHSGGDQTDLYEDGAGFVDNKDVATVLRELTEILDKVIQECYLDWSIPLVLDPRSKLGFVKTIFAEAFGQEIADRYISKISTNIIKLYNFEYITGAKFEDEWEREEAQEELNRYMGTSAVQAKTKEFDILKWWKDHGSRAYPMLAEMAKGALAMPTCNQLSSKQTAQLQSICRGYWL